MVDHTIITDPYLHEPKGASTASLGEYYISDGEGSGSWQYSPTGWGFYADNGVDQTFTTTPALMSVDGLGSDSTSLYLPRNIRGTAELWDASSNEITPVALGDLYTVRVGLPITAETGSPTEVIIEIGIGEDATYVDDRIVLSKFSPTGRTTPYIISREITLFGSSSLVTDGGRVWVSTDAGSVTCSKPSILINRTHGEVNV